MSAPPKAPPEAQEGAREAAPPAPTRQLGARLRAIREAKGTSLRQLARDLGISPSAVSQIERGKVTPSVARLIGMVNALGAPLSAVLDEEAPGEPRAAGAVQGAGGSAGGGAAVAVAGDAGLGSGFSVRRAPNTEHHSLTGVTYRRLAPPLPGAELFESVYAPGAASSAEGEFLEHRGIDAGTVVSGRILVESPTERIELRAGDAVTFHATTPHRLINPDPDRVAVLTWLTLHGATPEH